MDPERNRLELLEIEAARLCWRLPANAPLALQRKAWDRMARRTQDLRNLDALILCDALDPSDPQELAERC